MKTKTIFVPLAVLVFCIAAAPFLRCWDYGMINLDDYFYLCGHPEYMAWQGWVTVRHAFTDIREGIWMPLTWLSFVADYGLFGEWYGGFHLTSVFLHALNAALVFCFLRELFVAPGDPHVRKADVACFLAALVWAVHPLRCESVVFLSSRKDVLSFFWELLALIAWTRGSKDVARSAYLTALACLFFVVGSLCKPSVMTFPVLCFLVDAFVIRDVRLARYVVPVAYMLFLGPFAAWQQKGGGNVGQLFNDTLLYRILNACASFGIYVRNFVWPRWLAPQCVKMWPQMPRFLLPGLVISGVFGWYLVRRALHYWDRRTRDLDFGWRHGLPLRIRGRFAADSAFAGCAWFAIALVPMLGIASFGYHSFADRFTYIPAVGLSILLAGLLKDRFWLPAFGERALVCAFVAIVPVLCVVTWWQTGFWRDDRTLFEHTLEVDGDQNACAHNIIANWYFEFPHDLEKSAYHYKKAADKDVRFVAPSMCAYAITLAELDRGREIEEPIRKFDEWLLQECGPERAKMIWTQRTGLSEAESLYMTMYYASKVAWWLTDKSGVPAAEEVFKYLTEDASKDLCWIYLKWRAAKLKGNEEDARRLYKLLKENKCKDTVLRFRYLRHGDYDGLKWVPRQ